MTDPPKVLADRIILVRHLVFREKALDLAVLQQLDIVTVFGQELFELCIHRPHSAPKNANFPLASENCFS